MPVPYTERQARELVEAFRGVARRIVAVSSADVYRNYDGFRGKATAPPDPVPLSEDAPLRQTRYPYQGQGVSFVWADDYDKIPVERIVLSEPELPGTILPEDLRQPFDFRYELATHTTRIRKELSYSEPTGREEGLKRTVEWERLQQPEHNK